MLLQLNQPDVVDAISRHLRSDPAFAALLEHSDGAGPPSRWLIEELQEEPEAAGTQPWPAPGGWAEVQGAQPWPAQGLWAGWRLSSAGKCSTWQGSC